MHDLSVTYSPSVLASPALRDAAKIAAEWLTARVGPSLDPVSAEWDTATDAMGQTVLTVRLRDFSGQVSGVFTPDEFETQAWWEKRLSRLYQDLLGVRSRKLLESLATSFGPDRE